jgi:Pyruvate/2-oxoacid:ferredoxin oxidoreductase delta subunit
VKIHVYHDGSYGYQYEIGDRVIVKRTIHGAWFDYGPTHSECCTVKRIHDKADRPGNKDGWRIAQIEVHYSNEWGCANCFPWMLEPHEETLTKAERIEVSEPD